MKIYIVYALEGYHASYIEGIYKCINKAVMCKLECEAWSDNTSWNYQHNEEFNLFDMHYTYDIQEEELIL